MTWKSYGEWLRHNASDPLWWPFTVPILINGVMSLAHLIGAIDQFNRPFSLIENVAFIVTFASLLLSAVRGEEVGSRKQMSFEARVGWAGASALVILFILETSAHLLS